MVKVDESFTTFEHITINDFLPNNSVMSIVEEILRMADYGLLLRGGYYI